MVSNISTKNCDENDIHDNIVLKVKADLPDEAVLYEIAELFKVFGDLTRVKILNALSKSEMCVCCIAELFEMSQSAISHQLRVLKQSRLVKYRKVGKTVYYSLCDDHIETILNMGVEHISE